METFEEFLKYLKKNKITEFTFKSLSEFLSKEFLIPKSRVISFCKKMKDVNMIEKVSISGNCQSTCASCYEYGCEEPGRPPINFWKVKTLKL